MTDTDAELGYIQSLRRHVGHAPLIMVSGGAAVIDGQHILLQQRDEPGGPWGLPGGATELGESPAQAAVRETLEETGLHVRIDELVGVYTHPYTYPNGDQVQAVLILFVATPVGGGIVVDGIESRDVAWFPMQQLPAPIFPNHSRALDDLTHGRRGAWD